MTNAVPNPATVTQNDVGDVVISPGVGKNLGVNAGNIIVNPDRITVKKEIKLLVHLSKIIQANGQKLVIL